MKKLTSLLILVCSISMSFAQVQRVKRAASTNDSTVASADQKSTQGESRKDMMKELNLTKEQKIKMKEMRQANKAALDEITNNDKLSQEEKKTRIKALRMEQLKNTMAILNEEQKAKLKQLRMQKQKEGKDDGEMQEQ
jgi:Spy/CpxP family protein refolding chaperone